MGVALFCGGIGNDLQGNGVCCRLSRIATARKGILRLLQRSGMVEMVGGS